MERLVQKSLDLDNSVELFFLLLGSGLRNYGGMIVIHYSTDAINWQVLPIPLYHKSGVEIETKLVPYGEKSFKYGWNFEMPNLVRMNDEHYLLFFGKEGDAPANLVKYVFKFLTFYRETILEFGCSEN